jgi:hypothetical protein
MSATFPLCHARRIPDEASLAQAPCSQHPLEGVAEPRASASSPTAAQGASAFAGPADDPLSALLAEASDPLGASSAQPVESGPLGGPGERRQPREARRAGAVPARRCRASVSHSQFRRTDPADAPAGAVEDAAFAEEWSGRKQSILNRFSVSGNITVNAASFDVVGRAKRGLSRLEQLADPDKGSREESLIMTQEEFVSQLREMNEDIARAWMSSERVTALKLATRVARLLCDTSVPSFYPTLFVLVTEVMDTMGRLVYNRIHSKAEREDDGTFVATLPPGFTSEHVRQDAKETCWNWHYKIGAIRDLLPRCYMEMAILSCYHFLQLQPPREQLARLGLMLRGLGDPLAAAYARAFLATRASQLLPGDTSVLEAALGELSRTYAALAASPSSSAYCAASGLPPADYVALLEPPMEWLLLTTVRQGRQDTALLERLLAGAGERPPLVHLCMLHAVLPHPFVARNARRLLALLKDAVDVPGSGAALAYARAPGVLRASFLRRLGEAACAQPPPAAERAGLLRDAWRQLTKLAALPDFLGASDAWLEFALHHFGAPELEVLLADVQLHLSGAGSAEEVAAALGGLSQLLSRCLSSPVEGGVQALLRLPPFLPLLDAFPAGPQRSALLRQALGALTAADAEPLGDAGALHFALEACRSLAEAAAAEPGPPGEPERREAGRLAGRVLAGARFGRDLEGHLDFLVTVRATLWQLPAVQEQCCYVALRLAAHALAAQHSGVHSSRSGGFARACIAFAHVTAPSLPATPRRAWLFLLAARCALSHGLLPHADALLRCCVQDVAGAGAAMADWAEAAGGPAAAEAELLCLSASLCGALVVAPGSPERGALHLIRPLCEALRAHPWAAERGAAASALLPPLRCLHALRQAQLPYHLAGVESNDVLYAGDGGYTADLDELASQLAEAVLAALPAEAGKERETRRLAGVRLQAAATFLCCFSAAQPEVNQAVDGLVTRAAEAMPADDAHLRSTVRYCKIRLRKAAAAAAAAASATA